MDLVLNTVKNDLFLVLSTAQYMLMALFLLAVFFNYLGILTNQANWHSLILRFVIGFILIQNYTWMMDTTIDIVSGLDQRINPEQSAVSQYTTMSFNMQERHDTNTQRSLISGITDFFSWKNTLHNLIINLSFIFYAIISKVMETVRYTLVAIMYKLGPILIPLILFQSTKRVLQGWFTSFVAILSWPILWHIALSIAVAFSFQIGNEGIEQFAALNFAICFVLVFSPLIANSLVSGVGLGAVSAIAGAFASKVTLNKFSRLSRHGVHGASRLMELYAPKASRVINNQWIKARTMSGRIRDYMKGERS